MRIIPIMVAQQKKRSQKMKITVTIDNQKLGLDDFVDRWAWGLNSITYLGNDMSEHDELLNMQSRVKELAVKRFFKLYEKEQTQMKTESK